MRVCTRLVSSFLVGAIALTLGCNQAQPAVNRVQPNVVDKAGFDGEWYYLQTVIDTPYSVPYTFVGEQSLLEKVTWEIQEELLIARRAYAWLAESEGPGITGQAEQGAAVASAAGGVSRSRTAPPTERRYRIAGKGAARPWRGVGEGHAV